MNNQPNQFNQPNIPQEPSQPQPNIQPEMPRKSGLPTWISVVIVVLSVMVVGLVSYGAYWYFAPQPEPAELPTADEGEPTDETADWQTYRNEEYGYEIKYPKNWKIEEARIVDPEGINPTESVICFGPRDKIYYRGPGTMNPICVETSTGALEQYRKIYPEVETEKRKEMTIGTYSVSVEERVFGEIFYIFENPTNKNIRVTIRDSISMITIADIAEENDLKNIFNQILSTFKFIEADETAGWQTYRNDEYGFEVKYPNTWIADERAMGGKYSTLQLGRTDSPHYPINPPGELSLTFNSNKTPCFSSNKELLEIKEESYEKCYIQDPGGNKFRLEIKGQEYVYRFICNIDLIEEKTCDQILSTFKFIN